MRNLVLPLCFFATGASAQPFAIGHVERIFYDAERERELPCELYYPSNVGGDDASVADGSFPKVIVGHGFVMGVDAYTYLWEHLVPLGFIVVLPTTEGGFAPVHAEFGADLAFLNAQMDAENNDFASLFVGHVAPPCALVGHSMGGGAAMLGAAGNTTISAMLLLAPAETSPSAIAAASQASVPTLLFAGEEDCVTPIAAHAQPMYDALTVECKGLVTVLGGGHCYFGDENFLCDFGELTCGPELTITREQQHAIVTDLGTLWLRKWLLNDEPAYGALLDSLSTSARVSVQHTCLSTGLEDATSPSVAPYMNSAGQLVVHCPTGTHVVSITDALGRQLPFETTGSDPLLIRPRGWSKGPHVLRMRGPGGAVTTQAIVLSL